MRPYIVVLLAASSLLVSSRVEACSVQASGGFNNLISTLSWIAGISCGISGIRRLFMARHLKAKGEPFKNVARGAKIRLVLCVLFIAYPFVQTAMQGSISTGELRKIEVPGNAVPDTDK